MIRTEIGNGKVWYEGVTGEDSLRSMTEKEIENRKIAGGYGNNDLYFLVLLRKVLGY